MASRKYTALRVYDEQLFIALQAVAETITQQPNDLAVYLSVQGGQALSVNLSGYKQNGDLRQVFKVRSRVIARLHAHFPAIRCSINIQREDLGDQIDVSFPDDNPQVSVKFSIAVISHFPQIDSFDNIQKVLGTELTEFYLKREEALTRLEGLTQKLIEQNEEYRHRLDQEKDDFKKQLQQDMKEEMQKVLDYKRKAEEDLKGREQLVEERVQQLDDRDSRHARRALRADLKSAISDRTKNFQLSEKTNYKRYRIHILFAALILVPGFIFFQSVIHELFSPRSGETGPEAWFYMLKPFVSGVALVAALVFYIRWENQWFHQHANEELRLKRLDLDIDRASWVVENALEWKDEKGSEIPSELLDRLSYNLFADEYSEGKHPRHPTEDLASALLGASTSLSMKIPGVGDALIDRKGIKSFKKAASQEKSTD